MQAPKISGDMAVKLALGAAAVGVAWYLLHKALGIASSAADVVGGALTGNNELTQNATDSNGHPVTAYQDAGPLGTLGAATNAVSGGYLATFGSWLGGKTYDLTHFTSGSSTPPGADLTMTIGGP